MIRIANSVYKLSSSEYSLTLDTAKGCFIVKSTSSSAELTAKTGDVFIYDAGTYSDVLVYDASIGGFLSYNRDASLESAFVREYDILNSAVSARTTGVIKKVNED